MVDRYTPVFDEDEQGADTEADPEGDYVSYQDYSDLEDELQSLKDKFDELKEAVDDFSWMADKIRR